MITYRDQYAVFAAFGEIRLDAQNWRLVDARIGTVHGLPNVRGHILCTNGILALVDCGREYLFECHLDNFIVEPRERVSHSTPKATSESRNAANKLDDLLNEL